MYDVDCIVRVFYHIQVVGIKKYPSRVVSTMWLKALAVESYSSSSPFHVHASCVCPETICRGSSDKYAAFCVVYLGILGGQ